MKHKRELNHSSWFQGAQILSSKTEVKNVRKALRSVGPESVLYVWVKDKRAGAFCCLL